MLLHLFSVVLLSFADASFAPRQCYYHQGSVGLCPNIDADLVSHFLKSKHDEPQPQTPDAASWLNLPLGKIFSLALEEKNATWTLRLPVHAKKVYIARLKRSRIQESIFLNETDLEQRRLFAKEKGVTASPAGCDLSSIESNFLLLINITDQIIRNSSWYVVCTEFSSLEEYAFASNYRRSAGDNSTENECTRCVLIKTSVSSTEAPQSRFLQSEWLKNEPSQGNGAKATILHYTVANMPFQSAKLVGTIYEIQASNATRVKYEFTKSIKPKQSVYLNVPGIEDTVQYLLRTDIIPETENGTSFNLEQIKLNLILKDYLHEDE